MLCAMQYEEQEILTSGACALIFSENHGAALQDNDGTQGLSRTATAQGTRVGSILDDAARWRLAAKLVQALRDAGYECELRVGENLH